MRHAFKLRKKSDPGSGAFAEENDSKPSQLLLGKLAESVGHGARNAERH
jgi:hypothetical protein